MNRKLPVLIILYLSVCVCFSYGWSNDEKVLYEGDSLYHHIRVSEVDGYRYLSFNRMRGSQSAVNIENPFELKFSYTKASFVVPAFLQGDPKKILYVGLGGGSIPKLMAKHYPDAQIDVVEIDQGVVDAAQKYFFFKPTAKMKIIVMDGRKFLRRCRDKYDLIFLDAYDDRAIPFHLTTKEFFEIVKQKLAPGGVLASNVWGPSTDQFYRSEIKTYQQVFPNIYLIDAVSSSNYIIMADVNKNIMTKEILEKRMPALQKRFQFDFSLQTYAETFEDLSKQDIDADVLLDDFAPVEILRSQEATSK